MTAQFQGSNGSSIFVETSDALPLYQLSLTLHSGSTFDPPGKEGLARLAARMWRMGTDRYTAEQLADEFDALGAHFSVGVGRCYTHIGATVVERNLDKVLDLVAHVLTSSTFLSDEFEQQQRETIAALDASLDDDGAIAGYHFRRIALAGHLYGRPVTGTRQSVNQIQRDDLVEFVQTHMTGPNALIGLTGPMEPDAAHALLEKHFAFLPNRPAPRVTVPHPELAPGRRLILVDKPDRTQSQVVIGTVGSCSKDPEYAALVTSNTAFGGLFTSRLTNEVRAKRGWSYGASSGMGNQPQRDLWSMRTSPAEKDTRSCVELQLRLLEGWVDAGLDSEELERAKDYLIKSHPFESDTAYKRLEHAMDQVVFEIPDPIHRHFPKLVDAVTQESAQAAVRARIEPQNQLIVVLGTAAQLEKPLAAMRGVDEMVVIPFDSHW